jgi:hypothetical protein
MIDAQFVQHIDWHRTVGLQLGMINNQEPPGRNQFYDRMLACHVRDRCCVDIGFGTGLLSMLAVKHGAEHIEAWEQDRDVFELGLRIILKLGLQHRISLHHGKFNAASLEDRDRVVFHEIIGSRIWNEGLRRALPLEANVVLPPQIICEFDVLLVDQDKVQEVFFPKRRFLPGVITVPGFDELVQQAIDCTPHRCLKHLEVLHQLAPVINTDRWSFYDYNFSAGTVGGIYFDHIPQAYVQQYEIKLGANENMILYPRITLQHGQDRLHWGWYDPIIIDRAGIYEIEQDFDDGLFTVHA